jgi:hypothetical protein
MAGRHSRLGFGVLCASLCTFMGQLRSVCGQSASDCVFTVPATYRSLTHPDDRIANDRSRRYS